MEVTEHSHGISDERIGHDTNNGFGQDSTGIDHLQHSSPTVHLVHRIHLPRHLVLSTVLYVSNKYKFYNAMQRQLNS